MSSIHHDEPLSVLEIPLEFSGEGSEFRTQNRPGQDWERRDVIERADEHDAIHVYCDLMDVKHGTFEQSGSELGTVMVFRFRFDPQKSSRRIKHARVKIEFLPATSEGNVPVVDAIAPEERWSLLPTTDAEQTVHGGELNLGASGVPFLEAGGTVKMEKTVARDLSSHTTVTGAMQKGSGSNWGDKTCAVWTLIENERRKSGVPDSLRVAVRLRREDDQQFHAAVTIDVKADIRSSFGSYFRKVPLDDPVLFNPKHQSARPMQGRTYGVEDLAGVDLLPLCGARMSAEAFWVNEA